MTMVLRLLGCLAVCLALVATAPAQDARVPSSPGEIKLSFAPVVKRVTPAVVNVYAARVVENRVPLFDDPIFRRFFGGGSGGPREQVQRSLGSGVILDASEESADIVGWSESEAARLRPAVLG
jgi:S1-C subfamily serine protease